MRLFAFTATMLIIYFVLAVGAVTYDVDKAMDEAIAQDEAFGPDWRPNFCNIRRMTVNGHTYAVRTSRTEPRRVCLIDRELNPAGCDHLTCKTGADYD